MHWKHKFSEKEVFTVKKIYCSPVVETSMQGEYIAVSEEIVPALSVLKCDPPCQRV